MQETTINFSGLALTPYSDISPDGQLSACTGLESHGGALRPSLLAGKQYTPPSGSEDYTLIHVHTTSAYSHFIFRRGDTLCWADVTEGEYTPADIGSYTGLSSVNSVGNTLVVLTSGGLHYLLWKDSGYKYIGQRPPEIGMAFSLGISVYERSSGAGTVTLTPSEAGLGVYGQIFLSEADDQRVFFTNVVWGAVNKVIEGCTENNMFCMPFFVRAAYRRFDGSYTMLTHPVLMIPDSVGPKACFNIQDTKNGNFIGTVTGTAWAAQLTYMLTNSFASDIQSWSDIISAVDIFVSPQVMRADDSQQIYLLYGPKGLSTDLTWHEPPSAYGVGSRTGIPSSFQKLEFDWELSSTTKKYFKIPLKDEETYLQDLNGSVQFYKVRSISVSQLSTLSASTFYQLLDKKADLTNLVQLETLPDSDDYQSHDAVASLNSHVYNQRLHLFDVERRLFAGFLPENAWAWTDSGFTGTTVISVYLTAEDGATRIVRASSYGYSFSLVGRFLYYPDANATRMVITGPAFSYDVPLQPHPLLGGAYHIFLDTELAIASVTQPAESSSPVKMANKVYTSEVGNPFYFPLEGIYTVGAGQIYGLSSIATALSQGQFGQFPLMIFCSDGNYAMSVDDEGHYSAIHPMQRDVCINPASITQTDSEVLFVTSRGVMVTSGASAASLSAILDGVPETLPSEVGSQNPEGSPSDFFRNAHIAYDYTNRRIIFFSPDKELAYVYAIDAQTWSVASFGAIRAAINQFPYAYVQRTDGTVLLLSEAYTYTGSTSAGLICTRPVKMGTYALKKILRLSLQGVFAQNQEILVYASNDCLTWHFLGRSAASHISGMAGRMFKYYRFAVVTALSPSENISALRILFEESKERRFR